MAFTIGISQILVCALGVIAGIVFGAIPGMTATMAVAVFLPLTYAYDLETALYLLLGLYVGGISGGLISLLALLCCNILMFIFMFYPIKWISKIIYIPRQRLYPVIIMICIVGAYATKNGRIFDVWALLIFGVVGYIFSKIKIPTSCFLIGFILGKDLENYFIQAISADHGSLLVFFKRPIGLGIWVLILASIAFAIWDNLKDKKKAK